MPFNADRILAVKLVADVSSISKDVKQAERGIKRASTKLKGFARGAASWGKAFAGAAVITGIESLAGMIGDAVEGAREGERQFAQLQNTATQLGIPIEKLAKGFDAVSAAATAVGQADTPVQRMFTALVTKGDPAWKATRKVTAALDVAAKLGIPVEAAGKLIQQAMDGNAKAARRLGVDGRKGVAALKGIEERFGGAAEAAAKADPFAVAMERIGEAFETIAGIAILPILAAVGGLMQNVVAPAVEDVANKLAAVDWANLDWGKALTDALSTGLAAVISDVEAGKVPELLQLGAAIAAAIFVAGKFIDAAVLVFSPSKWHVGSTVGKAVREVGKLLGIAFRVGMFLTSKFIDAAAALFDRLSIAAANPTSAMGKAAANTGKTMGRATAGGFMLGFVGAVAAGLFLAAIVNAVLDAMGVPQNPGVGPFGLGVKPPKLINGRWTTDYASGTGGASRGWHLVGEGGPELVRFRGGEQVLNSRATADAMGSGATYNISVQAGVGDPIAIGREVDRVLRQYRRRAGLAYT